MVIFDGDDDDPFVDAIDDCDVIGVLVSELDPWEFFETCGIGDVDINDGHDDV